MVFRSLSRFLPLAALLWILAIACVPAGAQEVAPGGDESASRASVVDPRLATPGTTLRTFFESFGDPATGRPPTVETDGIATIEFSGSLALLDTRQRVDAARTLKNVIDRMRLVDTDAVDRAVGDADRYVVESIPGTGVVELVRNDVGEWRFGHRTVESLDRLWSAVAGRSVVEGVTTEAGLTPAQWVRSQVPAQLRRPALFLEGWQWLGLLALIAVGVAADRMFVFALTIASGFAERRLSLKIERDDRRQALRPFGLLAMAAAWAAGINLLLLPAGIAAILTIAVKFVAAASFVWAAYKFVDTAEKIFLQKALSTESRMDDLVVPFLGRVGKIFVVAFGIVFVASNAGVNISGLLAGLGLGGLAFALAAKDTVSNIFGSVTILLDRPFSVGDWVTLENGVDGTVESVGLRSTRVRTFHNSLVTVPNSTLITAWVDNYGARQYRRWRTTLSLTYDTPPEKIEAFCEGIRELVRLHPYTRKDYFHVYANEFGAASLDILLYVFFAAPDWGTELRERHRLFLDILRLAKDLGVEFAFPTQTLHIARGVPDHADAPTDAPDAVRRGESSAQAIVRRQFGETVVAPPPVRFDVPGAFREESEIERRGGKG